MVQSYCSVINLNTHFGATALYVVTRFSLQHLQLIMDLCEPDRSSAYSEDLRWRMVWKKNALGFSSSAIAKNLNVHRSTVDGILQIFLSTGCVSKRVYPKEACFQKITPVCAMYILNLVISKPSVYLREIQAAVEEFLLIDVSISAIGHFLASNGFTRQKLCHMAI